MTEARKAIFVRFNCENQAESLHGQLTTGYEKLKAGWPNLPYTDDVEANGNLLLVACFEAQQEGERKRIARYQASVRQRQPFRKVFGVELAKYWNIITGFDICQFDEDIVKSPDEMSVRDAVKLNYGDEGLAIVLDLMQMGEEK